MAEATRKRNSKIEHVKVTSKDKEIIKDM
jgi:hypothetical protein